MEESTVKTNVSELYERVFNNVGEFAQENEDYELVQDQKSKSHRWDEKEETYMLELYRNITTKQGLKTVKPRRSDSYRPLLA
jgi:hypothetical protein